MEAGIGSRIKLWRQALGLTQAVFAERIGVHIGVLKKYEQGLNVPGGEALAAIARTGVNMTWLLTGEGEMRPQKPVEPDVAVPEGTRYARRWRKIIELVDGFEDEADRAAFIEEVFSRAKTKAELDELRRAFAELKRKAG